MDALLLLFPHLFPAEYPHPAAAAPSPPQQEPAAAAPPALPGLLPPSLLPAASGAPARRAAPRPYRPPMDAPGVIVTGAEARPL
jgi:hypothetical protein